MTCRKVAEYNGRAGKQKLVGMSGSQGLFAPFATEADCLQACREGACCEGTTCTVKPQCQCQGSGKTFKGVGTTCAGGPCGCCGNGESLPTSSVSVLVARTLDVIAYSSCACMPFMNPPTVASRCRSDSGSLTQYGAAGSCSRSVSGTTSGVTHEGVQYSDSQNGTVAVGQINGQCFLYVTLSGFLNPCGGTNTPYYAWPFVPSQAAYSATYYVFLFVDGAGRSDWILSTSSSVPAAPPHPLASQNKTYFYGGAMWTVSLTVTFA